MYKLKLINELRRESKMKNKRTNEIVIAQLECNKNTKYVPHELRSSWLKCHSAVRM